MATQTVRARVEFGDQGAVLRRQRARAVDEGDDHVRRGGEGARPRHPTGLDVVVRRAQARGVDRRHAHAAELEGRLEVVARGPRRVPDQGALVAEQGVQEARLPGVRSPDERHARAVDREAPCLRGRQQARQPRARLGDVRGDVGVGHPLLGVVEGGDHVGVRAGEVRLRLAQGVREAPGEPEARLPPGGVRPRLDHGPDGLGTRQVELAVHDRPKRELPGTRRPGARAQGRVEHRPQHRRAAVELELDDVLPRVGPRGSER